MATSARRRRGAFTLLELVVVIALVGGLSALAALRLRALRAEAERAAVEQVLGALRASVALQALALLTQGRDAELEALVARNPMQDLLERPASYVGELARDDPAAVAPGRWYFEREGGRLVYRLRFGDGLRTALPGPPRLRFRARLLYDDRDGNGRFDAGRDGVGGAVIEAAEPYAWDARAAERQPPR